VGSRSFGHDEGRARFAASLHGEGLFATGRDAIDLIVTAGATFRVLETVRAAWSMSARTSRHL